MVQDLDEARRTLARYFSRLADIPEEALHQALPLFQLERAPRQRVLLRAGERPTTIAFVISGLLRLFYIDRDGSEYTKSFCAEGELVAAYSALLLGRPSQLFIETLEPSVLLTADYDAYRQLTASHGCWERINRQIAEALFIKKELREAALLLDDAQTRYLQFHGDYPHLAGRVRQHHIASYLGITPISLSRIRARLRAEERSRA